MSMKKPTGLNPKKVATSKGPSPHLRLSPTMGAIPSPLDIAAELENNLGPSKTAMEEFIKLQYNLVDLFNLGEVQMSTTMDSLFKWKDKRDEDTREKMRAKILALMVRHYEVLSKKIDIGRPLTWGIYNSAVISSMASFKEDRKKMIPSNVPIGSGNIGFVRVLMH